MRILAVCSTTDFVNFTRRATLEAIVRKYGNLDFLLFSGIKQLFRKKRVLSDYKFYFFYYFIPAPRRGIKSIAAMEISALKAVWQRFFSKYDVVFFNDPNQYFLLNFVKDDQKIIYLIRDPNILQNPKNELSEKQLLERADIVLGTSKNLTYEYVQKYYGMEKKRIFYWPNTADFEKWHTVSSSSYNHKQALIGVAGNLNSRTDLGLLNYLADNLHECRLEIFGKNFLTNLELEQFLEVIKSENIEYKGYIPQDKLPEAVSSWKIGIAIEKKCEYTFYTHHNKIYQYMALGIPVVTLRIHNDYDVYPGAVFVADDYQEFLSHINYLINLPDTQMNEIRQRCVKYARENSSETRAKEFLKIITQLN